MAMNIKNRTQDGANVRDPSSISMLEYSETAGARKVIEVGRSLLPLQSGATTYTTNATTPIVLPSSGKNLAIYNSSGTVAAVTVGDSTMTPQAAGAVQSGATAPFVGVACQPNAWTYLSTGVWNTVASSSASLYVYLIEDTTSIVTQPATNAST